MKTALFSLGAILALVTSGCVAASDELTGAPNPSVEFKGEPEERFVGTWKTDTGLSVYQLKKDGSYELDSKIAVRGQESIESHLKGEWKVHGKHMLFKDANGNVVPYLFSLEGDQLELSLTSALKSKTVMTRQ